MDTRSAARRLSRSLCLHTTPLACALLASCVAPASRDGSLLAQLRAGARRAPLVVAHRGDSAAYPENTLPAFHAALEAGADLVELDFVATRDGSLICLHDKTLDRTTDAIRGLERKDVKASELALAEVQALDAGSWKETRFAGTRVPTLEAALGLIQPTGITLIERKEGTPAALVELLRRLSLVERVVVQSFDWEWLEAVHRLEPRLLLGALGDKELTAERLAAIERAGARLVHWSARDLRLEDVAALRARGHLTAVFTLNDDLSYLGAAALGIDAITTDRPGALRQRIAAGQVRAAARP